MKSKIIALTIALIALVSFVGCEEETEVLIIDNVPAAPQGVYSVTGDGAVYLYWNSPYEDDIAGFIIWRSFEPYVNYVEVGTVDAVNNPALDLLIYEYIDVAVANGVKYYYAVSSYDDAGQISELSAEDVFDTPRPEGTVVLSDMFVSPTSSGFGFAVQARVSYDSPVADIFIDRVDGIYYINVVDIDTDIQDMGYTDTFDDISYSPLDGWSENGWAEIILGHTYVIWTRDSHYAKVRVTALGSNSVDFEWAYQTLVDEPELVAPLTQKSKPIHNDGYLSKSAAAINQK